MVFVGIIARMNSGSFKFFLVLAGLGLAGWKMTSQWFGPAVTPGEVAVLTSSNFYDVKREAGTLVALYMKPG
jgi:hypothetical protein